MLKRALLLPVLLAGCAQDSAETPNAELANPASVYCVEQGGQVEIHDGAEGQIGYCHLPDGRVVEEWDLFRSSQEDSPGSTAN